jgi:hypothetical protein
VTTAECGVVYSITMLLIMGTIIEGFGVFRYEQLSSQEKTKAAPTSQDVYTNVIAPKMIGLDPTKLTCTLTMTANTATVTLTYLWIPEGLFNPITLTSTSVQPITY